jgi:hypothetical protein
MSDVQNRFTVNIVDAGIFRSIGKPPNDAFDQLETAVKTADNTLLLPKPIYEELGGNPTCDPPPSDSDYVGFGIEDGWIEVADEIESHEKIELAMEMAEQAITDRSNHPKTACAEEDASLIGLAAQRFVHNQSINVNIHTTDKALADVALVVLPEIGYYSIDVYEIPPQDVVDELTSPDCFTWKRSIVG